MSEKVGALGQIAQFSGTPWFALAVGRDLEDLEPDCLGFVILAPSATDQGQHGVKYGDKQSGQGQV